MNLSNFLYSVQNANPDDLEYLHLVGHCLSYTGITTSQNFQDIWVLYETEFKRNGFFVEFGATNGIDCSNTYILERNFAWNGILAEPNPVWHTDLFKNRYCGISNDCVYTSTGEQVEFSVVKNAADLSTISGFENTDEHSSARSNHEKIKVNTITLFDLLESKAAPSYIDYLSIDTEGSELYILKKFFEQNTKYNIGYITVEHNNNIIQRFKIKELLEEQGYTRKFMELSRWDDYYAKGV